MGEGICMPISHPMSRFSLCLSPRQFSMLLVPPSASSPPFPPPTTSPCPNLHAPACNCAPLAHLYPRPHTTHHLICQDGIDAVVEAPHQPLQPHHLILPVSEGGGRGEER